MTSSDCSQLDIIRNLREMATAVKVKHLRTNRLPFIFLCFVHRLQDKIKNCMTEGYILKNSSFIVYETLYIYNSLYISTSTNNNKIT